jgi:hypothetical protein
LLLFGVLLWQSSWLLPLHPPGSFWRTVLIAMICVLVLTIFSALFTFNWIDPARVFTLGMANLLCIQANAYAIVRHWPVGPQLRLLARRA